MLECILLVVHDLVSVSIQRDRVIYKICRPLIFMSLLAVYIFPAEHRCEALSVFWESLVSLSSKPLKHLKQYLAPLCI